MIYKPKFAAVARDMCRLGATDEELAEHFNVCVRTIYRWRNTHEEFAEAVVVGKQHADARVERALYSRAVGCSVQRIKVFKHAGDPNPVYATYTEQLPPDPNAALQWLRVRQREKWGAQAEDKENPGIVERLQHAQARLAAEGFYDLVPLREPPPEAAAPEQAPAQEPLPDPDPVPPPVPPPAPAPVGPLDPAPTRGRIYAPVYPPVRPTPSGY